MTLALCSTTLWFFPLRCMSIWVWDGAPTLRNISHFQQTIKSDSQSPCTAGNRNYAHWQLCCPKMSKEEKVSERGLDFLGAPQLVGIPICRWPCWSSPASDLATLLPALCGSCRQDVVPPWGKWQNEQVHIQDQTWENDVKARSQMEQWRPCGLPSSSLPIFWPLALNFWGIGTAEFRLFSLLREVK